MIYTEKNPTNWQPGRWYSYLFMVCISIIGFFWLYLDYSYKSIDKDEKNKIANSLAISVANANSVFTSTAFSLAKVEQHLQKTNLQGKFLQDTKVHTEIRNLLIQEVAIIPGVISMSVLDHHGKWIISSRFKEVPQAPINPERPVWNAVKNSKPNDYFLLPPSKSPSLGMPSIAFGRPVFDRTGKLSAIVIAFIAEESIQQIFGSIFLEGQKIFITNSDGNGLLSLPNGSYGIPKWIYPKWQNSLEKGIETFDITDDQDNRWNITTLHSTDNKTNLIYTVLTPRTRIFEQWWLLGKTVVLAGAFCLITLIILSELWIQERKRLHFKTKDLVNKNSQLHHIVFHDTASNLLNANGLEQELTRLGVNHPPIAIHVISIERLQALSDTLNLGNENSLIQQISSKLTSCLGANDIAARLANEEFCIAQYGGDANKMASNMAVLLGDKSSYILGDRTIILPISAGTAINENGTDWHQLLREARSAMERARSEGGGKFLKFEPSADKAIHEQLLLEQDFRAAIGTHQLYMMYQPICHVATGKISGFESLMRWNSPSRGMVPPGIFIPMAERRGLLLPIDQMVERSPLLAAKDWPDDISVSINCPAFDFLDSSMATRLQEHLHKAGINPRRCYIEVTESALLQDDEQVLSVMRDVKALGVNLAIDDFGSGHASLSYLHKFPFNLIKIDRSFIQAMDKDAGAAAIVEATLTLSQRLGLDVVAEGVETPEQFLHLKKLGCTYVQGYWIAKPMNEDEISHFVKNFNIQALLQRTSSVA